VGRRSSLAIGTIDAGPYRRYAERVTSEVAPADRPPATQDVPFLDLWPSHEEIRGTILDDIAALIRSGRFIGGPQIGAFEDAFAVYCETRHAVGMASGLDALRLALLAMGLEPGDEVIVPAATFVASLEAVTQAGGRPVLVDVSDDDYCLAADAVSDAITARTRVVMPVHLYGQMTDMRPLLDLAHERGIAVLEDACQAHGATRDGLRAGSVGNAAAFSFYPAKNLGAFGDAGALVTNDEETAVRVRALREHGQRAKYRHEWEGYTARLDTIQAVVLMHKLPLLDDWNEQRREAAALYGAALEGVGDLGLPHVPAGSSPVWHLFVVRTADPEAMAAGLACAGVGTGRHYPEPPHLSQAYEWLGYGAGAFPVAERLSAQGISLPIFPGIAESQIARVAEAVEGYFRGG
jgi:dTDP-4-amino-4,6-dideoxygalactose transaminase